MRAPEVPGRDTDTTCPVTCDPDFSLPLTSMTSCINLPSIFWPGLTLFALSEVFTITGSAVPGGRFCADDAKAERRRVTISRMGVINGEAANSARAREERENQG